MHHQKILAELQKANTGGSVGSRMVSEAEFKSMQAEYEHRNRQSMKYGDRSLRPKGYIVGRTANQFPVSNKDWARAASSSNEWRGGALCDLRKMFIRSLEVLTQARASSGA